MLKKFTLVFLGGLTLLATACSGSEPRTSDAAATGIDASAPGADAGAPGADAGAPGADAGAPGADAGAPGADAGAPGADAGADSVCDEEGYRLSSVSARELGSFLWVLAENATAAPIDYLSLEIYDIATYSVGEHALTDEMVGTCHLCVLIFAGCASEVSDCTEHYLAQAGSVAISSTGGVGDTFTARLTGVELIEVNLDLDEFVSTPVPNGRGWCIDEIVLEATIE